MHYCIAENKLLYISQSTSAHTHTHTHEKWHTTLPPNKRATETHNEKPHASTNNVQRIGLHRATKKNGMTFKGAVRTS